MGDISRPRTNTLSSSSSPGKVPVRALRSDLLPSDRVTSFTASSVTPTSAKSGESLKTGEFLQAKGRKTPYKHRAGQGVSQSFSLEAGEVPRSVLVLEKEVKRLKQAFVEKKTEEIADSKETRRSSSRLSTDIDRYESRQIDQEFRRLTNLFLTSESELAQMRTERDRLLARVKDLEARNNSSNMYETLGKLQGENKMLMLEVRRLQEQVRNQGCFRILEVQFHELESLHSELIADNTRLKQELDNHKEAWRQQYEKLVDTASLLRDTRKDVTQVTEMVRIVRNGAGVSTALILGHMTSTTHSDDQPELSISKEAKALKEDVGSLKSLLADLYAESAHNCAYQ